MMAAWGPDDLSGTDASEGKGPMSGQPVGDLKYTEDRNLQVEMMLQMITQGQVCASI